jgi:molybdate transport system substrate-binding protein
MINHRQSRPQCLKALIKKPDQPAIMKIISFLPFILLLSCQCFSQTLRIAVAANAQFVMQSLKDAFEKQDAAQLELVISSSGKLTAQIEHGAPYAIFLSADMRYPEALYKKGFATSKPQVYAYGKLVLWTLKDINMQDGIGIIQQPGIKTIAIGNPATAPYGVATVQALKKAGLYDPVKKKIVLGESISQVNQYLITGAADVAFTAKAIVLNPKMKNRGKWVEINDSLYQPIKQGTVILTYAKGKTLQAARRFYHFLFSPKAKAIFTAYGYRIN